jgi:predicted transcriptional regulator
MIEELVGYVLGNRKREQILEAFSESAIEMTKIAKTTHIPERLTTKLLEELEKKRLIKADDGVYSLTESGFEVNNQIKGM